MIFDTHIHLNDSIYQSNLEQLINEALESNVKYFLVVGYNLFNSRYAIELSEKYPFIYASIGIHPSEVNNCNENDLLELKKLAKHPKVVAIGEIGLDYYHGDNKEEQSKYFISQIAIANDLNLPIVVHSRDSIQDTYDILNKHQVVNNGIMHCYSSSIEMAKRFIELGYYIAIGGAVTFKNASNLKLVAKELPLDKLLVETDAPWLTPHPYRGKLNHPKYITYVVAEIANLKSLPYDEIAKITTNNAFKVLRINHE